MFIPPYFSGVFVAVVGAIVLDGLDRRMRVPVRTQQMFARSAIVVLAHMTGGRRSGPFAVQLSDGAVARVRFEKPSSFASAVPTLYAPGIAVAVCFDRDGAPVVASVWRAPISLAKASVLVRRKPRIPASDA